MVFNILSIVLRLNCRGAILFLLLPTNALMGYVDYPLPTNYWVVILTIIEPHN
jgi:hypothetical protein